MTEKEKAKAYDEAIERAKKLYINGIAEEIFPELKDSDDERIRKNCIHFLELQKQHHAATFEIEECIDWLEKQGKQLADKNKPRFEVSDWVVFIASESVYQVEKKENYEYTLRHILGGSFCLSFSNEKLIREWTIQDAKDGDVLACNEEILLFKSYSVLQGRISLYCWYNGHTNNFHSKEVIDILLTTRNKVYPATKEQRDLLFQKIKEAGYKWNVKTKTLDKLVKHKFDPKTLKPFDKVLCKVVYGRWHCDFFSCYIEGYAYPNICISGSYLYCIPYNEDTKHLVGTTDEAPEYYRYLED